MDPIPQTPPPRPGCARTWLTLAMLLASVAPARAASPPAAPVAPAAPQPPPTAPGRAPILIELFTSEGCSSCPSADTLLAQLAAAGEVEDTPVIALELHVDYWNYLGWRDPFSDAAHSRRQGQYVEWLRGRGPYTPQLVVAGRYDVLGSDATKARAAILQAADATAAAPRIALQLSPDGTRLRAQVRDLPRQPVALYAAVTESGLQTQVPRGENSGRTLRHGPIVRWLSAVGHSRGGDSAVDVALPIAPTWGRAALQVVLFAQDQVNGHILGAAATRLTK